MLLNIEATTNLLAQVLSPNTFLAALITFDGRVVAYHVYPNPIILEPEDPIHEPDRSSSRTSSPDGSDQAKIVAAIASGLWRQESYERSISSSPELKIDSINPLRHLDAVCEDN